MNNNASAQRVLNHWEMLRTKPGGKLLFSFLVGRIVPYSGSIGAMVEDLQPGYARLTLKDRKKVRNNLGSFHAISLANLGELTAGLAVMAGLPPRSRIILRRLEVAYEKKARGLLTSTCTTEVEAAQENIEHFADAEIRNEAGEVVALITTLWVLGPEK